MPKPNIPGPPSMPDMKNMRAYTVAAPHSIGVNPRITIGKTATDGAAHFTPKKYQNDSYWIAIIDRMDPKKLVAEFTVPGQDNSNVPSGLDQYMTNENYLFAVLTSALYTTHVPQGAFFDYLVKYGAGRELRRLEQVNTTLGCGYYSIVSYALTGQCGPRAQDKIAPPSYEVGSPTSAAIMLMSLMPLVSGPPYSICDTSM